MSVGKKDAPMPDKPEKPSDNPEIQEESTTNTEKKMNASQATIFDSPDKTEKKIPYVFYLVPETCTITTLSLKYVFKHIENMFYSILILKMVLYICG